MPKQGYVLLDSLYEDFSVQQYTLNTSELYGINKTVEIFNVSIRKGEILLVFSVLPPFVEEDNWKKITLDSVKSQIYSNSQVRNYAVEIATFQNIDEEYINSLQLSLVKKVDNEYYVSKVCLSQRFTVHTYPHPLSVILRHNINIRGLPISIREFLHELPGYAAVMNPQNDHYFLFGKELLGRYYFSKSVVIGSDTAYQFWTFADWQVKDSWNIQRGIDRFVFIPGKGIMGGSYDFWFAFKPWRATYKVGGIPVKKEKLWDNIINEKVMLAEGMNGVTEDGV